MGANDSLPIRPDGAPDGAWNGLVGVVLQRGRPYGAGPPSFIVCLEDVQATKRPPLTGLTYRTKGRRQSHVRPLRITSRRTTAPTAADPAVARAVRLRDARRAVWQRRAPRRP